MEKEENKSCLIGSVVEFVADRGCCCSQNNTDSGLPHGPEEFPYGCADLYNAAGEL